MMTPIKFMECVNGLQKSAVVKAAVELEVFTHIARGHHTAPAIAQAAGASLKGTRILLDALTILDLIGKHGGTYTLTRESALFLDKDSPEYVGSVIEFQHSRYMYQAFLQFTDAVRRGGSAASEQGTMEENHEVWIDFARAMIPMALPAARVAAELAGDATKVLDVAAGHGMYGITVLQRCATAQCVGVDWANVLPLAEQNAVAAQVRDRWTPLPGSVFDVGLGGGYDLVLVPNLLHHFSHEDCVRMLRRLRAAMAPNGRLLIVEMVPHDDRVTPSAPAWFAVMMLASTAEGDAYTAAEYEAMLHEAGFAKPSYHPVPGSARSILATAIQ